MDLRVEKVPGSSWQNALRVSHFVITPSLRYFVAPSLLCPIGQFGTRAIRRQAVRQSGNTAVRQSGNSAVSNCSLLVTRHFIPSSLRHFDLLVTPSLLLHPPGHFTPSLHLGSVGLDESPGLRLYSDLKRGFGPRLRGKGKAFPWGKGLGRAKCRLDGPGGGRLGPCEKRPAAGFL
jgi:hypothetical protein